MKKLVLLILVGCLLVPMLGLAEGIDVSGMSLQELVDLRKAVTDEINSRVNTDSNVIHSGEYVVGKHIAPGAYLFTCIELADSSNRTYAYINHVIYDDNGNYLDNEGYPIELGNTTSIILQEGDEIEIDYGALTITPYFADWFIG